MMFSNKVWVNGGEYYVILPRPLAMLQNWGSGSWKFLVHHYKPAYFRKFNKLYRLYFKVFDIFVTAHWPEKSQ
jgi:hypothetical protein